MNLIRTYDTNEDVLVVRKSDYQNNNIGDGYFIVPKDEWFCEDDGLKSFHLFLTKFYGNRVFIYSFASPQLYQDFQRGQHIANV